MVPQWIISTPKIDPLADANVYEWFQRRILGIFNSASGDLKTVLNTISGYSLNGSIPLGGNAQTIVSWGASTSPVQFNPYFTKFRLDAPEAGNCGVPAAAKALTRALYHEARHAYQGMLTGPVINGKSNTDEDQDFLVNVIKIAPIDIIIDNQNARDVCNELTGEIQSFTPKGPNNKDAYGSLSPSVMGVSWAVEMDAWKFASQH
jgi:hypothetical protein